MKKILSYVLFAVLVVVSGCKKEYAIPAVSAPANENVEVGSTVDLAFDFTAEGGYGSSSLVATNGTAVIKTNAAAGETAGSIIITFTAGTAAGAGSVVLTLTDGEGQTGTATAVLDVKMVPTISVTENISANTTWETGKIYVLEGRITVLSGSTLTIQPGVIVKGREGSASNATALMIARGGKLDAQGTADSPIIFTSVADEILPGEIASPNLEPTINGLWGGLLVLGNAPISASASVKQIEGIPVSDLNGQYGGTDPLDNSGIIKYVSIRHGGANIGEGNEINGLTLGGVGSGTVVENIEIIANQDDGIEWFGGTVNVKNVIFWNAGDDAVDTDQSWGGTLDNFVVINPFDECFELDGPEGTMIATHTLKNGSVKAMNAEGLADLDDNTPVVMDGIYFFAIKAGQDFDDMPVPASGGLLTSSNLQATIPAGTALSDFFKEGTDAFVTSVTTPTVGATVSVFSTWSWASTSGALTGF